MISIVQRAKNSLLGAIIGFLLLVGTPIFLFLHEGKAASMAEALDHIAHLVHHVGSHHIDPQNNGKLVHTSGPCNVEQGAQDSVFNVQTDAVVLFRKVEVFQQFETKDKKTGEVTKHTRWVQYMRHAAISTNFFVAHKASLGAYELSPELISQMQDFHKEQLAPPQKIIKNSESKSPAKQGFLIGFRKIGMYMYKGRNLKKPQVGDVRVSFYEIKPEQVSVIAVQQDSILEKYNPKADVPFMFQNDFKLIQSGVVTAEKMIYDRQKNMESENNIFRLLGLFLIFLGVLLVFAPITNFVYWIPIINGIIGLGVLTTALVFTVVIGGLAIAAGWLFYRPLFFIITIIGAGILLYVVGFLGKKKQEL